MSPTLQALTRVPAPVNEPVLSYASGSPERHALKAALARLSGGGVEIPLVIGGKAVRTGRLDEVRAPHRRDLVLARGHQAGAGEARAAIDAALAARRAWAETPFQARAAIFLRAAELLATRHRATLNAATMLGQSKTAHQAEIDAACETVDFWRWNVHFAERILAEQPASAPGTWNLLDARPLEGFVFAVTPFNFTAIGANLPTAPALMGNTVVWKPAHTASLSAHFVMEILREAGLPDGVINFVPGPAAEIGALCVEHPELAGIHFTGSTGTFNRLWGQVGANVGRYRSYPRLVGETGGKDFIVAHPSADVEALAVAIVRGGFEYQGQKCSAASRLYLPRSLWRGGLRDRVVGMIGQLKVGDVADFSNFMGAVIDEPALQRISGYLEAARGPGYELLAGGRARKEPGFFVEPTLVESADPRSRLMSEEIFGPVVTAYVYDDAGASEASWRDLMRLVDSTSPYALTGAVFSTERAPIDAALVELRQAAGNFYVNDKPTGAVVGQQPFGGARGSGTNDKAGSLWNLTRWVSPRTIKETLSPPRDWSYPFMQEP